LVDEEKIEIKQGEKKNRREMDQSQRQFFFLVHIT
jgi:hypothetical protein